GRPERAELAIAGPVERKIESGAGHVRPPPEVCATLNVEAPVRTSCEALAEVQDETCVGRGREQAPGVGVTALEQPQRPGAHAPGITRGQSVTLALER